MIKKVVSPQSAISSGVAELLRMWNCSSAVIILELLFDLLQ